MQTKIFEPNEKFMYVGELQAVYRKNPEATLTQWGKIGSSTDVAKSIRAVWKDDLELFESFLVVFLNRNNQVIGHHWAGMGGVAGTVADPKRIFGMALKVQSSAIILAHNHPSGNTKPSSADIKLTRNLKECGKFLEIDVLDHLIITGHQHYSFADEGLL